MPPGASSRNRSSRRTRFQRPVSASPNEHPRPWAAHPSPLNGLVDDFERAQLRGELPSPISGRSRCRFVPRRPDVRGGRRPPAASAAVPRAPSIRRSRPRAPRDTWSSATRRRGRSDRANRGASRRRLPATSGTPTAGPPRRRSRSARHSAGGRGPLRSEHFREALLARRQRGFCEVLAVRVQQVEHEVDEVAGFFHRRARPAGPRNSARHAGPAPRSRRR